MVRPVLPTHLLKARAKRVIESIRQENIFAHFGKTSTPFDDQLRDTDVAFDVLVQTARNHFTIDIAPHIGDFFRPLVDQQDTTSWTSG